MTESHIGAKWQPLGEASLAAIGMVLFALCVHQDWPLVLLSALGLLVTAGCLTTFIARGTSPARTCGLGRVSTNVWLYTSLGLLFGVGLGIMYRRDFAATLLPHTLGWFAILAAVIGSAEECLYRGYIQGRLRTLGPIPAVLLAAMFHTAYKCALFAAPPFPVEANLGYLARYTFLAGLVAGALRELAGHLAPPVLAHAGFDLVVYGELSRAPWWVWS